MTKDTPPMGKGLTKFVCDLCDGRGGLLGGLCPTCAGCGHIDASPSLSVVHAAWALCDDTEGSVFTDEFGEHYRVPKDSWDRLSAALGNLEPRSPGSPT